MEIKQTSKWYMILEEISRLFYFVGIRNYYKYSGLGKEADYKAIKSDWQHVGNDMREAINYYEKDKK